MADRAEIQLAFVIGGTQALNVFIDTHGTSKVDPQKICEAVQTVFKFTPGEIIEELDLRKPIFRKTTNYGHFGREDQGFAWEKTDKADALKKECGL